MGQWHRGAQVGSSLTLRDRIGTGGMGEVWRAYDEVLGRDVAVKLLAMHHDIEAAALLTLLEARAAARVVHPHVVAMHAIGDHAGVPYLEMEWVDGPTLRARMQQGPIARREAGLWLAEVAAALDCAHRQGVVHCDIKPENVLLKREDAGPHVAKLADFGLARRLHDGQADRLLSHGTTRYLAPELAEMPPTPASDVFALAAMSCELLTGQAPQRRNWTDVPTLPGAATTLPAQAHRVLLRAMAGNPSQRHETAGQFADDLLRALGLGQLRPAGRGLEREAPNATSHELAMPLIALGIDLHAVMEALLAVLPPWPGALEVAMGGAVPDEVLADMAAQGTLAARTPAPRLADHVDGQKALASLPGRVQRLVMARAAVAIETSGPRTELVREDATRLYVAARRLPDAARLALQSADATEDARLRRHHLVRAVGYATNPARQRGWLESILLLIEWDLRCGRLDLVRAPLAEAQGLLADLRLPMEDALRLRTERAVVRMLLATGAAEAALHRLALQPASARDTDWHALQVAALAQADQAETALQMPVPTADLVSAHHADWLLAMAEAAAARSPARMERFATQALAAASELGDPLRSAQAQLALAKMDLLRDRPQRARLATEQALGWLHSLGAVSTLADANLLLGKCLLRVGQPVAAMRALGRAEALCDEMQLVRLGRDVAVLLDQALTAAGEPSVPQAIAPARQALRGQPRS